MDDDEVDAVQAFLCLISSHSEGLYCISVQYATRQFYYMLSAGLTVNSTVDAALISALHQ